MTSLHVDWWRHRHVTQWRHQSTAVFFLRPRRRLVFWLVGAGASARRWLASSSSALIRLMSSRDSTRLSLSNSNSAKNRRQQNTQTVQLLQPDSPSPKPWEGAKYCHENMHVCLLICLFVCSHNSKTTRRSKLHQIFVQVVRRRGGVALRYILPVLWMTSCFHTTGPMGQR